MKKLYFIAIVLLALVNVVSCTNVENAVEKANEKFIDSLDQDPKEPTYSIGKIHLHIPTGMVVTDEDEYNLVLEKNGQLFLLFMNPIEDARSDVNVKRDQEYEDEALVFEVIEKDNLLAYQVISEQDENDQYQMIIGIGGAKITTITSANQLEGSAATMTETLRSIRYVEEG